MASSSRQLMPGVFQTKQGWGRWRLWGRGVTLHLSYPIASTSWFSTATSPTGHRLRYNLYLKTKDIEFVYLSIPQCMCQCALFSSITATLLWLFSSRLDSYSRLLNRVAHCLCDSFCSELTPSHYSEWLSRQWPLSVARLVVSGQLIVDLLASLVRLAL